VVAVAAPLASGAQLLVGFADASSPGSASNALVGLHPASGSLVVLQGVPSYLTLGFGFEYSWQLNQLIFGLAQPISLYSSMVPAVWPMHLPIDVYDTNLLRLSETCPNPQGICPAFFNLALDASNASTGFTFSSLSSNRMLVGKLNLSPPLSWSPFSEIQFPSGHVFGGDAGIAYDAARGVFYIADFPDPTIWVIDAKPPKEEEKPMMAMAPVLAKPLRSDSLVVGRLHFNRTADQLHLYYVNIFPESRYQRLNLNDGSLTTLGYRGCKEWLAPMFTIAVDWEAMKLYDHYVCFDNNTTSSILNEVDLLKGGVKRCGSGKWPLLEGLAILPEWPKARQTDHLAQQLNGHPDNDEVELKHLTELTPGKLDAFQRRTGSVIWPGYFKASH